MKRLNQFQHDVSPISKYTVIYLCCSVLISIPLLASIYGLLYTDDSIPAGADTATHVFFIQRIIESGNPLIDYTSFPEATNHTGYGTIEGYYPSFMHSAVAMIATITTNSDNVLSVTKAFMFTTFFFGIVGYALLIKTILDKVLRDTSRFKKYKTASYTKYEIAYVLILLLAFGTLTLSASPIVKLFNDGTYGEIFAMWFVFPFYLSLLLRNKWIISGILLAVIASSHNLSLIMSLSATFAFFVSLLLQKNYGLLKSSGKFFLVFLLASLPAFFLFYYPTVIAIYNEETGNIATTWSKSVVVDQIGPLIYYLGVMAMILLIILDYRNLSWLSIWALIYFLVFDNSSLLGARFARELSLTFGILFGVSISYIIHEYIFDRHGLKSRVLHQSAPTTSSLKKFNTSNTHLVLVSVILIMVLTSFYFYYNNRFAEASNPLLVKYHSDAVKEANQYLSDLVRNAKEKNNATTILIFGHNPWLKSTVFGKANVLEAVPLDIPISTEDRKINQDLYTIIQRPNGMDAECEIMKHGIDVIYISDKLPGRFYTTQQEAEYDNLRLYQRFSHSTYLSPAREFVGEDNENIRIFFVEKGSLSCKQQRTF